MFTPPPSPHRPKTHKALQQDDLEINALFYDPTSLPDEKVEGASADPPPLSTKRRVGRRTKWTAILVPLALILITGSARLITHRGALDRLFPQQASDYVSRFASSQRQPWLSPRVDWKYHKRNPADDDVGGPSVVAFPSTAPSPSSSGLNTLPPTTTVAATAQPLPTIPSSPPVLPTPFPQAFNSDISRNFSSVTCYNFFNGMINDPNFRSCRPFSLLLQTSDAFLQQAQNNLTFLNTVMWGTCSTTISAEDCSSNMAGFAVTLRAQCSEDLADNNARAVNTLVALNAYSLMRQAGCATDPATKSYCFVNAVHNKNPSDVYYYQLPLGTALVRGSTPTCSACTKSLLSMYSGALASSTGAQPLTGLRNTYSSAAQSAVAECGSGYATLSSANAAGPAFRMAPGAVLGAATVALATLLT